MSVTRYRLLDLTIDLDRQRVTRDDVPLDVQGLSFPLLACLLRHGARRLVTVAARRATSARWRA